MMGICASGPWSITRLEALPDCQLVWKTGMLWMDASRIANDAAQNVKSVHDMISHVIKMLNSMSNVLCALNIART